MRETSKDILSIDCIVHNKKYLDYELVEYTLKVKSGLYLSPDEDENVSNDYILACLIGHLEDLLSNENIRFAIRESIISKR